MTFYNLGFLLFYAFSGLSAEGPCIGKQYFKGCCAHTFWNTETKDCEKCPSGLYGLNCSFSCQYPFFGDQCLSECSCNSSLCDSTKGCISTNDIVDEGDGIAEKDNRRPGSIRNLLCIFISVSGVMLVAISISHLTLLIVQKQKKKCGGNNSHLDQNGIYEIVNIQDDAQEQRM